MMDPPLLPPLQVEEGGASQLTSSVLSAADLDAPAELLTFTVVTTPRHGRLVRIGQGGQGAELLQRRLRPLSPSPAITSFSLQELQQGEGEGLSTPVSHTAVGWSDWLLCI